MVSLRENGEPTARRQFEKVDKFIVVKHVVADDVYLLDSRRSTLRYLKVHANAISLKRRHGAFDLNSVFSLREVGAAEFLFNLVKY